MRLVDSTATTIRSDGLQRFACPNERCRYHGARGKGNIRVNGWSGTRKRFRQLICHECGKTFSENYGTPFYGIHTDPEKIVQALKMVVERGSMRGEARAMGVDKDTVWLYANGSCRSGPGVERRASTLCSKCTKSVTT